MHPIVLTNPAGINNVGQIIPGVREDEVCVGNKILPTVRFRFLRQGHLRSSLDCIKSRFGSGEVHETRVEHVKPPPQLRWRIPRRIRSNEHELHLFGNTRGQFF